MPIGPNEAEISELLRDAEAAAAGQDNWEGGVADALRWVLGHGSKPQVEVDDEG